MAEFQQEDFSESIDDMCDDAVRRMFAIQEGGLVTMHHGDLYVCDDFYHDEAHNVTEFTTRLKTVIADEVHRDVIEQDMPDYALEILSGAVIALANHAAFRGRGSSVIVPHREAARSHVYEKIMMQRKEIESGESVSLYAQELGSLGLVNLTLARDDDKWTLNYDSRRRTALVRA
jgi:hypothetical protein